jgi:hypothetical protein
MISVGQVIGADAEWRGINAGTGFSFPGAKRITRNPGELV